jgi:hypothetical protein
MGNYNNLSLSRTQMKFLLILNVPMFSLLRAESMSCLLQLPQSEAAHLQVPTMGYDIYKLCFARIVMVVVSNISTLKSLGTLLSEKRHSL